MRLIDADELNELMTAEWFLDSIAANEYPREIKKKIENAIDSVSLAYDIDNVVAELEEKQQKWKTKLSESDTNYMDNAILKQYISHYDIAIEIVKRGGN